MTLEPVKWHRAKTYEEFAPHEYVMQDKYPEVFAKYSKLIAEEGILQTFMVFKTKCWARYYYTETHRYWIIEDCLNRDERYGTGKGKIAPATKVEPQPYCSTCKIGFYTESRKRKHICGGN